MALWCVSHELMAWRTERPHPSVRTRGQTVLPDSILQQAVSARREATLQQLREALLEKERGGDVFKKAMQAGKDAGLTTEELE